MTYDNECIFIYCETTMEYLSYLRDTRIVGYCFILNQLVLQLYHETLIWVIVERTMDIRRHCYHYLAG